MQKELLVAKRKKARELHQKGWSIDKIARHLVSSWRSVSRWIEMDSIRGTFVIPANAGIQGGISRYTGAYPNWQDLYNTIV